MLQSYKIIILNLCAFICFRAYSLLGGGCGGLECSELSECSGMLADARGELVGTALSFKMKMKDIAPLTRFG